MVFLQILHQPSVSWDITPLYFLFSWNCIYIQEKEPIKVQIWWNSSEQLKFSWNFALWWSPFVKIIQSFSQERTEELSLMTLKSDAKFEIWHEGFVEFSKVYQVWAKKIQRSYLSRLGTVMQKLNKPLPRGFKNGMRNWVNFH